MRDDGTRLRIWSGLTVLVAATVMLTLLINAPITGHFEPNPRSWTIPGFEPVTPRNRVPETFASDGGVVEVMEYGFSGVTVSNGDLISWGAVISNSSQVMRAEIAINVDFFDDDGERLGSKDPNPYISSIEPGGRLSIGRVHQVTEDNDKIAAFKVSIGAVDWLPPTAPTDGTATIDEVEAQWLPKGVTIMDTPMTLTSYQDGAQLYVRYRIDSTYADLRTVTPGFIFRDAEGSIIGGTERIDTRHKVPPGWSYVHVNVPYAPSDLDVTRIEIY